MADFILEIFSEEIPARMQVNAINELKKQFEERLKGLSIFYNHLNGYVTPRRLVISADGLSLTQEDSVQERKGPRTDAPEQALEGFLRSTGLTKDQLTVKSFPKGDFYFAIIRDKGRPTKDIIKEISEDIINGFTWPKSMRWGANKVRWVRPMQNIACVFGGEILPVTFGHITANNKSEGHRFLGKNEITISDFNSYEQDLKRNFVFLNHEKRREKIISDVRVIAQDNGLELIEDEGLLNEVTGLVEWPNIMLGTIDKKFMNLPEEVLIKTIKINQKYFCLRDKNGKFAPFFII